MKKITVLLLILCGFSVVYSQTDNNVSPAPTNYWETEFWDLVYKENVKKEDFRQWAEKYKPPTWNIIPPEYRTFYNTYLSTSNNKGLTPEQKNRKYVGFSDGFNKIPYMERLVSKDTEGLKKLGELIKKCVTN